MYREVILAYTWLSLNFVWSKTAWPMAFQKQTACLLQQLRRRMSLLKIRINNTLPMASMLTFRQRKGSLPRLQGPPACSCITSVFFEISKACSPVNLVYVLSSGKVGDCAENHASMEQPSELLRGSSWVICPQTGCTQTLSYSSL